MIEIHLVQGSSDWILWRRKIITGTDASIIFGWNPFRSRINLWEEKVLGWEQEFDDISLERMRNGQEMEPIARMAYEKLTGYSVYPVVCLNEEFNFLGCSMDGMTMNRTLGLEIKCGKKAFESAKKDSIPAYTIIQVQHQMLVTGLQSIDYFSYYEGEGILLTVNRDEELIKELLEKEIEFWHNVTSGTPPKD